MSVAPDVPGLAFDPIHATLSLWEDAQSVEFRFRPEPGPLPRVCQGWIHFRLESLPLADVPVAIFVTEDDVPEVFREALAAANVRPYRAVFPSYAQSDREVLDRMRSYAVAFGDEFLRDVEALRAGQRWSDEILAFIRRADVFQLFWSENAARSPYVEQEWRFALGQRKSRPDPHFVRPVFWTAEPAPIPTALKEIHFARLALDENPLGSGSS